MAWAGTETLIDNFNRAQALTTTPGFNGWTIKDTSSSGTPTYLCAGSGAGMVLTIVNTNEAEIVTMYTNDVLPYDLLKINNVWWTAKVAGIDAVTTLVMGVASAQNDTADTVTTNAWFRMEGSASTSALLWETDDNTTNDDDNATGTTLAATYKRMMIDFTQGMSAIRFFVDGALVGTGSMAAVTSATYVQPFVQVQKASGTGTPVVTIGQFGISYKWNY
jgi:hypothetical protein